MENRSITENVSEERLLWDYDMLMRKIKVR